MFPNYTVSHQSNNFSSEKSIHYEFAQGIVESLAGQLRLRIVYIIILIYFCVK